MLIRSAGNQFANSKVGDVGLYTGTSNQNVLAGPINRHKLPAVCATSSNMLVDNDMQITGNMQNNSGMICLTMGGPVGEAVYSDTSFSNASTFASTVSLLGSSNVFLGSNQVNGATFFSSSNGVTIGGSPTNQFPLHVINSSSVTLDGKTKSSDISIYMVGDYITFSDSNLKTDLRVIPDAMAKVNEIGGYTFSWLDRAESGRSAGVIAQEVQAVLPEVVVRDSDGKLGVTYGNLSALVIQAVKELACRRRVVAVTTTAPDEEFSVELPALTSGGRWVSAIMTSAGSQYSRTCVAVSTDGRSVMGRAEQPGTYNVLVLAAIR